MRFWTSWWTDDDDRGGLSHEFKHTWITDSWVTETGRNYTICAVLDAKDKDAAETLVKAAPGFREICFLVERADDWLPHPVRFPIKK